jgi:hypothetical protein
MQRNPLPDCHYPFKEDTKAIITPYQIHNFRTSFQIDVSTPPTVDEIKIYGCARFPINSHTMLKSREFDLLSLNTRNHTAAIHILKFKV